MAASDAARSTHIVDKDGDLGLQLVKCSAADLDSRRWRPEQCGPFAAAWVATAASRL